MVYYIMFMIIIIVQIVTIELYKIREIYMGGGGSLGP